MTEIGTVERVSIRKSPLDFIHYVPPKGIDLTFHQVDEDSKITNPKQPRLYEVDIITSEVHPDYPKEPRHITELLGSWRSIVSDSVKRQQAEPYRHKIVTITNRPHVQQDKDKKEMIDKLPKEKKWKDKDGNEVAEITGELREL
jgi:hypothetical protein